MTQILVFLSRWFAQPDKAMHAIAGLAGFLAVMAASQLTPLPLAVRLIATLCVVAFVGWLKERQDKTHPEAHTWDGWDAYATTAGGLIGAVAWILIAAIL